MHQKAIETLRRRFQSRFPNFESSQKPGTRYLAEEDSYKREAAKRLHVLFDEWVAGDTDDMGTEQLTQHFRRQLTGKLQNASIVPNLTNWRENAYILDQLLEAEDAQDAFRQLVHRLLKVEPSEGLQKALREIDVATVDVSTCLGTANGRRMLRDCLRDLAIGSVSIPM